MDKEKIFKINGLVLKYVLNLDDDSLIDLLSGRKKLSLVEQTKKYVKDDDKFIINEISRKLDLVTSKAEAREYIESSKFTVYILKEVAKIKQIYLKSRSNKAEIIDKLIEGTIGAKLKIEILSGR